MRTQLKMVPHAVRTGEDGQPEPTVEIWHEGKLIGTIYQMDDGVLILTKHDCAALLERKRHPGLPNIIKVAVNNAPRKVDVC